jgi:hypothetical protein
MTDAEMVEILEEIAYAEANTAEDRINAILTLREIQGEGDRPTPIGRKAVSLVLLAQASGASAPWLEAPF